jgi:Uma2 family endonuclease
MDLQPAWEVARLFPPQGKCSVADYLALTESSNQLVEYSAGFIEVLETPSEVHQFVLLAVYGQLAAFNRAHPRDPGFTLITAPFRIRLSADEFREPDLALMLDSHRARRNNQYWDRADLVVEILSPGKRAHDRDLLLKRTDYARAGIPEYWVVSPEDRTVTVFSLPASADSYAEPKTFRITDTLVSSLVPNLRVRVAALFTIASS